MARDIKDNLGREAKEVVCKICGTKFLTTYNKKMFCSFDCKCEANRQRTKLYRLKKNENKNRIY
jgi:redox-regulated HSP33 family molecular chaperone